MPDRQRASNRWVGQESPRAVTGPLYHRACPLGFGFSDDDLDSALEDSFERDEPCEATAEFEPGLLATAPIPAVLDDGRSEALPQRRPYGPHALMEVQQFLVTQMSQVNRRVADVYELHERRGLEDRKETYILVFALSVVLVFCFAAFFMHQMEVRDLHSTLHDEIERQEGHTRFELREKIETLGSKQLPELLALVDARLATLEGSEQLARQALNDVVAKEGQRSRRQASEMLLLLEDRLDRMQRELHDMRQLQIEGVAGRQSPGGRPAKGPARGGEIPSVPEFARQSDDL